MKAFRQPLLLVAAAAILAAVPVFARNSSVTVAVRGQTAADYHRQREADGTFKRETYLLANAGPFPGTTRDSDIDKVTYPVLAGAIAQNLAPQNYFLARKAADADLLLVIHWGTTVPFVDLNSETSMQLASQALASLKADQPAQPLPDRVVNGWVPVRPEEDERDEMTALVHQMVFENRYRDMMDEHNANLLGYLDEINARDNVSRWAGAGTTFDDLKSDIEAARYYVVIDAYDLPAIIKQKKKVLRWVTRISIPAQGNDFNEKFAAMIAGASGYFGQDSRGLLRRYRPDARVDLGEIKYLGEAPPPASPASK